MVEMVVVTPLLAMLCGFAFWFYQMHYAQMRVYQSVRQPVWETATFSCGNPGETSASFPRGTASVGGGGSLMVPADWSPVYRYAPGGPNNEVITRPINEASQNATRTVSGKDVPGILHISSTTYQASAKMMCNETVHDGQPDAYKRMTHFTVSP
jgi:hypothetical protein